MRVFSFINSVDWNLEDQGSRESVETRSQKVQQFSGHARIEPCKV